MTRLKAQDEDDGFKHYRVLGLPRSASAEQIKQAYRILARRLHPDKGGSSKSFAALQEAFEVLSDPKARKVYDALAADVRFRPGAAAPYSQVQQPDAEPSPPPGLTEALLLQQLLRARAGTGGSLDPAVQLCVTCEVCRRPATKECWTCRMAICDFCTRRQHWKGDVALHWPLVDSPGRLLQQLGQQELEAKRKEDGAAYLASLPGYRPQHDVQVLRQFQDTVLDLLDQLSTAQQQQQQQQQLTNFSTPDLSPTAVAGNIASSSSSNSASCDGNPAAQKPSLPTGPAFALAANSSSIAKDPFGSRSADSSSSSTNTTAVIATISNDKALASSSSKALATTGNNSSSSSVNKCWKAWQAADAAVLQQLQGRYDVRQTRFYMWTQTAHAVLLAVHMPTGGTSSPAKMTIQTTPSGLTLQHQGFAPVLQRAWAGPILPTGGISSWVSADGCTVALAVQKAQPGQNWSCCFKGDSHGARCLPRPYSLLQQPSEVTLELPLPFWVMPEEDLQVCIGERGISIKVDGLLRLQRTYWAAAGASKASSCKAVNVAASSWCVLEEQQPPGTAPTAAAAAGGGQARCRPGKLLSVSLALPEPTEEEMHYKKGVRQNNAAATRSCRNGHGKTGYAFFADDEDEFGLANLLQALLFHETGRTPIIPKPWELATGAVGVGDARSSRWIEQEQQLPADVQQLLRFVRGAAVEESEDAITRDAL